MVKIADPVMQVALMILVSVVMGTGLLIAAAFFRRWQQVHYIRYLHTLHRQYRPMLAKVLAGVGSPAGVEALRELPPAELELLLDPVFSKRKLTERSLGFLRTLCAELGLVDLWQSRLIAAPSAASPHSGNGTHGDSPGRAAQRYLLRAKAIRNLGKLRHRPSWLLLVNALDDRHPDIQLVALRSLATMGVPESFPVLRDWLHAAVKGNPSSPPLQGLQTAMVSFNLTCLPALLPSLRHGDRHIRLRATQILRTIVRREAANQPHLPLTQELLTPQIAELLLSELAVDTVSAIRAHAAEVIVFLADSRASSVLRNLLVDHQWFVRLRAVQALPNLRQAVALLHLDIRQCLGDPHWRVREAAIQTLIALGREGKHQLYEHFLTSQNRSTCEQIVEVIERTGLMSALVEEYSKGTSGVDAIMVEQLASEAAPLGLSGILRTLNPVIRQKFLDRFLPYAEAKMRFLEEIQAPDENTISLQQALEFPPRLAA
jgi:hypothetical protein